MHLPVKLANQRLLASDKRFLELFSHGTLSVELYKPISIDYQKPHDRDEVYIIVSGHGKFMSGSTTVDFQPNDFLFVPAGVEHRFIDFSDDFSTWVIFYGPIGGEKNSMH